MTPIRRNFPCSLITVLSNTYLNIILTAVSLLAFPADSSWQYEQRKKIVRSNPQNQRCHQEIFLANVSKNDCLYLRLKDSRELGSNSTQKYTRQFVRNLNFLGYLVACPFLFVASPQCSIFRRFKNLFFDFYYDFSAHAKFELV